MLVSFQLADCLGPFLKVWVRVGVSVRPPPAAWNVSARVKTSSSHAGPVRRLASVLCLNVRWQRSLRRVKSKALDRRVLAPSSPLALPPNASCSFVPLDPVQCRWRHLSSPDSPFGIHDVTQLYFSRSFIRPRHRSAFCEGVTKKSSTENPRPWRSDRFTHVRLSVVLTLAGWCLFVRCT